MSKKNIALFLGSAAVLAICAFNFLPDGYNLSKLASQSDPETEVTLEFWGLWDSSDSWQTVIKRFEQETHHWNGQDVRVKINYTKKDIASYQAELEKSYAENKSPSVFMISNYWLEKYSSKLEPLTGNKAYTEEYNLLDYEEADKIFPLNILQDAYLENNTMYAMPVYSDSLALYYNKDLFQKAGIENPPATWDELKADVRKLTVLERNGNISQCGIALGGGKSINRSSDILSLLTLQGGGKMVDNEKNVDFNKKISVKTPSGTVEREPGMTAIQFYMEFSDPDKQIYSWNESFENSVKDFAEGKVAMMLGYSYQQANLLALKPELNYGIAPAPQIPKSTPVNISNVWFPVISNQSTCTVKGNGKNIDCGKIAWSFLSFANKKENIAAYLDSTGKAAARIDIIKEQMESDKPVNAFAKQAAITRSYNKFDDSIDAILVEMLDKIYKDRNNWRSHADAAAAQIEELKNNENQ